MAHVIKKKAKKGYFYYIQHTYKEKDKTKILSKYLGKKVPENIDDIKKEMEYDILRKKWQPQLKKIKQEYNKYIRSLPKKEQQKIIAHFLVEYVYNSNRIEGSKLSQKDTKELFLFGTTPINKPLDDVKEAEGHKKAFEDMIQHKGALTLKKIQQWHHFIFKETDPDFAGKLRKHRVIVTGSRVSFPFAEDIPELLKEFFAWYKQAKKKIDPVELAALAHLKFVTIHPFGDGNGRISRLIANVILSQNNYPLFNIQVKEKKLYYNNLESSQLWNNPKRFVRFFINKYISENKKYLK